MESISDIVGSSLARFPLEKPQAASGKAVSRLDTLREAVDYAYQNVPFYRDRLGHCGVKPETIRGEEDFAKIPFTTKSDLRSQYPLPLLAVPPSELRRVHSSSGTTGKPTVASYTERDLRMWSTLVARALSMTGLKPGMMLHNAYGYGLATGGLAFHEGAQRLGLAVIPSSLADARRQVELLRDLPVQGLLCTPSAAATLAVTAGRMEVSLQDLSLKIGVMGGEAYSEAFAQKLTGLWGIDIFDTYGLSEVLGPGVAQACPEHHGLHLMEDAFFAEIVDFATGIPVPEGEEGELVLTTLTKEAMPVLRYRTRDRTRWLTEPCACGLPFRCIEKIAGRRDEVVFIGEEAVLPTDFEAIFLLPEEVLPHYQLECRPESQELRLRLAVSPPLFSSESESAALRDDLEKALRQRYPWVWTVELVDFSDLPLSLGKAPRILFS